MTAERPTTHALDDAFRTHREYVYRVCLALLRDPVDAEDAVQETFVRAAGHLDSLTGDAGAYLTVVARRVCYRELNERRRRLAARSGVSPEQLWGDDAEELALARSTLEELWQGLASPSRRLFARVFAGYTASEIAKLSGSTTTSVTTTLWRTRRRARALVRDVGPTVALVVAVAKALVSRHARAAREVLVPTAAQAGPTVSVAALVVLSVGLAVFSGAPPSQVDKPNALPATAAHRPLAATTAELTGHLVGSSNGSPERLGGPAMAPASRATPTPAISPPPLLHLEPRPQDTMVESMTVSPAYDRDHTVFAAGLADGTMYETGSGGVGLCVVEPAACPVLFVTHDGGTTWHTLSALGWPGGSIVLPPTYPSDPTIFSIGAGLFRSDDQGRSFRQVVGGVVSAIAIPPGAASGRAQVLVMTPTGALTYDEAGDRTLPAALWLARVRPYQGVVTADGDLDVLSPTQPGVDSPLALLRCDVAGLCNRLAPFDLLPATHLVSTSDGGVVAVEEQQGVLLSVDGGHSFAAVSAPGSREIDAVAVGGSAEKPEVVVTSAGPSTTHPGSTSGTIAISRSAGRDWSTITGDLDGVSVGVVALLPDGRVLAAPSSRLPGGYYGIRCATPTSPRWNDTC